MIFGKAHPAHQPAAVGVVVGDSDRCACHRICDGEVVGADPTAAGLAIKQPSIVRDAKPASQGRDPPVVVGHLNRSKGWARCSFSSPGQPRCVRTSLRKREPFSGCCNLPTPRRHSAGNLVCTGTRRARRLSASFLSAAFGHEATQAELCFHQVAVCFQQQRNR
jgi:hypothetical protein